MPTCKTESEIRDEIRTIDRDLESAREKLRNGEMSRDWFVRRYEQLSGMRLALRWALGEADRYD